MGGRAPDRNLSAMGVSKCKGRGFLRTWQLHSCRRIPYFMRRGGAWVPFCISVSVICA